MWKEAVVASFNILLHHILGGIEKTMKKFISWCWDSTVSLRLRHHDLIIQIWNENGLMDQLYTGT
jgi:hypothetical protein